MNQAVEAGGDDAVRVIDESAIGTFVPLSFPLSFRGQTWDRIWVRHPSAKECRQLAERIRAATEAGQSIDDMRLPMTNAPDQVLDALRADDEDRVSEAIQRFLPRRYRAAPASESALSSGESSPTS